MLTLTPRYENQTDVSILNDSSSILCISTDDATLSSDDNVSPLQCPQKISWPGEVVIPLFSVATETVLRIANEEFAKDGTVLNNSQIKSEIMETDPPQTFRLVR